MYKTFASLRFNSSFHALRSIIANEGFFKLYNGLSAGLARQATYTTVRLGTYTWLLESFSRLAIASNNSLRGSELFSGDKAPSFATKAALGMAAGAVGSFFGNPTEVLFNSCV